MRGQRSMDGVVMGSLLDDLWMSTVRPALQAGVTRAGGEILANVGQTIATNQMVQEVTVQKSLETAGQQFAAQAKQLADLAKKYKFVLLAGGVVAAAGIGYMILRKRK